MRKSARIVFGSRPTSSALVLGNHRIASRNSSAPPSRWLLVTTRLVSTDDERPDPKRGPARPRRTLIALKKSTERIVQNGDPRRSCGALRATIFPHDLPCWNYSLTERQQPVCQIPQRSPAPISAAAGKLLRPSPAQDRQGPTRNAAVMLTARRPSSPSVAMVRIGLFSRSHIFGRLPVPRRFPVAISELAKLLGKNMMSEFALQREVRQALFGDLGQ